MAKEPFAQNSYNKVQ